MCLESQLADLVWRDLPGRDPSGAAVMRDMLAAGFSATLARELLESLPKGDAEQAQAWMKNTLTQRLQVMQSETDMLDAGGVFALMGPTGAGKTWLACALAHKACRDGYRVHYLRLPRLFQELPIAKGDGRYPKLLAALAKTDVLVLDDWGLSTFSDEQRRDMLEILEDRHGRRATLITSQLPVEHWHEIIGDPTLADAILDRLVHNAYKINLKGESMRKRKSTLTHTPDSE